MAFVQIKLTKSINQSRGIFDKYIYHPNNNDLIADILGAGYFNASRYTDDPDWIGGIIEISASDGYAIGRIAVGGLVTLYDSTGGGAVNVPWGAITGDIVDQADLADVAKTNDYDDLTNLPDLLDNRIMVKQASDLSGSLDSTKEYFVDGFIDMGSQPIEVPQGGLTLTGYSFDLSKLTSSVAAYTMFTSPVSGSGNIIDRDFAVEVTGAGSQVYDLVGDTGLEAIEHLRINWNNCTSLGTVDSYRQGLETGTGRFGGTPELTLAGTWVGGYFIDTSIVRNLSNGSYSLFSAGAGFVMNSRFRSNQNIDLPASASFLDFAPSNFVNPSTLQLDGCIITRDGVADAEDTNITPNIDETELISSFIANQGMKNTFVGGKLSISAEAVTTINTQGVFEVMAGTFTATSLVHFDNPTNGQARNLGVSPRDFLFIMNIILEGPQNDGVEIRVRKFDFSSTTTSTVESQVRVVNNLSGGRNVAFFNLFGSVSIDQNDYIFLEVTNNSSTGNVTAELDSFYVVTER